jgi:acyl-CoA thioester hydrolase
MHYLEHTRNEFLNTTGTDFATLHGMGIDIVLARITMQLKTPLKPGDEILSKLKIRKERIKYVFDQVLFRKSDNKISCKASVELVCLINGKLGNSDVVDKLLLREKSI